MDLPPRVAVAASGGLDSSALLHATCRQAGALGVQVLALHVHHGLQAAAEGWMAQVEQQAQAWGATFVGCRLAAAPARGDSVEAWARDQRYRALADMARTQGCSHVLLAHHRRDQAETFLLQALRAAGVAGQSGMPREAWRNGVCWLRPWLAQPREAIEAYARAHGIRGAQDPSNTAGSLARARLRRVAWPALLEAFPDAETTLAAAAGHAQQATALAREVALDDLSAAASEQGLRLAAWESLGPARRQNLLRAWLHQALGTPPPQALVQRLLAELPTRGVAEWPTGVPAHPAVRRYRGLLRLAEAPLAAASAPQVLDLSVPGCFALDGWRGSLWVEPVSSGGLAPALLQRATLHGREQAEERRFALAPRAAARSLKKQYQALGVPSWQRGGPFISGADGALLFVPGLGLNALHTAPEGSPQLGLRWQRDEAGS